MRPIDPPPPERIGLDFADLTDIEYLSQLVRHLAQDLAVAGVGICQVAGCKDDLAQVVALHLHGRFVPPFRYELSGTPCEGVTRGQTMSFARNVAAQFPGDAWLVEESLDAYVGLPLHDVDGRTIGLLMAVHSSPIDDPARVLERMSSFARRAGAELERSARSELLRERTRRLVQQSEVLRRLARSEALALGARNAFLHETTLAAAATLGVERATCWLFDRERTQMESVSACAGAELVELDSPLAVADYPEYFEALASERLVATTDSQTDPRTRSLTATYLAPHRITSMLEAPLLSGGELAGVLYLEHVGEPRLWYDDEQTFAASLADLVSLALEAADRRRAESETAERNRELSALQRISELSTGSASAEDGLIPILAEIKTATDFPVVTVQLYDRENRCLILKYGHAEVRSVPLDQLPCGEAVRERRLIAAEAVDQALRERYPILGEFGIGSFISVPLESHRRVLGTLFLAGPEPRPISERMTVFATGLGNALSAFLERQTARKEEERLKVQLLQSRKLEAIGTLAGGVAHDFNNLLTGILGYAWRLKQIAEPGDPVDLATTAIENAAERASQLTQRLLGFARRGSKETVSISLDDVVHEAAQLLDRTLDENVRVLEELGGGPCPIHADPGQLHLMLLNMAVNARDAMPGGGTLTFATRTAVAGSDADGSERRWVELEVLDTGSGIPPEHLHRVFEPFFTTKEVGQGTGMGLAMVYGIVQSHGGDIQVENRQAGGTRFRIRFPQATSATDPAASEERPVFGRGHVLVVDDEDFARDGCAELLRSLGYTVTTAKSGMQAIATFEAQQQEIDLVVLDIVMPRMGGRECLRALKRIDPHVRVVLASDWSLEGIGHLGLNQDALGLVEKPFQLVQLSQIVASVLEAPRDEPALS